MSKNHNVCKLKNRSLVAAVMLLIYGMGTIGLDVIHHIIHDHAHVSAPAENQFQDAAAAQGITSAHSATLIKAACCRCSHLLFQANQLPVNDVPVAPLVTVCFVLLSPYQFSVSEISVHTQQLRGPPAV